MERELVAVPSGSAARARWPLPCALVALGLLVSAAFVSYRVPPSDEGALLAQAVRILRGAVFYRDLDAYPFPLAPYLLAGAMAVFGEHLAVARWLAAVVFCGVLLGVYAIAVQLLERRRALLVTLALLSFKLLAWPGLTAYSYWDLSFAFACGAIALALDPLSREALPPTRLLAAGILTGLALLSKQSVGIYLAGAALALLLLRRPLLGLERAEPRQLGAFLVGLALLLVPTLGYFAWHGVLGSMLYSGLVRPFVSYLPTSGISPLVPLAWWQLGELSGSAAFPYVPEPLWRLLQFERLPGTSLYPAYWFGLELFARLLYTSLGVAALGLLVHLARALRGRGGLDRPLVVFAGLAGAVVLSAFPRADFPHLISVFPLVGLLLARLGERGLVGRPRLAWISGRLEVALVVLLLAGTGALTAIHHAQLSARLELERATLHIDPVHDYVESVVRFVQDEVAEDGDLFVLGHEAQYYFLTGRYHPWRFVQLYPGQTGRAGGVELVELLRRAPPRLIIRGSRGIPGIPGLASDAPVLDAWVKKHYVGDRRGFERYPPPRGWPHHVLIRLLRPREDADGEP